MKLAEKRDDNQNFKSQANTVPGARETLLKSASGIDFSKLEVITSHRGIIASQMEFLEDDNIKEVVQLIWI